MVEEARALGGKLPAAEAALQCFEEAARAGLRDADPSALPARWARQAKS